METGRVLTGKASVIGKMKRRITVQTVSRSSDGKGGATESWSTFASVWANIEPVNEFQPFFSEQLQHRITHRITIRYLSGIDSKMRIVYGSRTFQISTYRDLNEDGRFQEIMAREGVGVAG